jgi:pre-mRNA-processing factor 6
VSAINHFINSVWLCQHLTDFLMIEAGVRELWRHQVLLTREQWLKEAERCETEGSPRTCEAIVKATVAMEVEEEDRLDTWVSDAESAETRGMVGTARAILAYALKVYPDRKSLWRRAAELEKAHGTRFVFIYISAVLGLTRPGYLLA